MWTTFLLGISICVAIYVAQKQSLSNTWRILLLFPCFCWFMGITFILGGGVFLGKEVWWETTPWKDLIMFLIMFVGMEGSVVNSAIINRRKEISKLKKENATAKIALRIDKWDLFQPAFFSLITFCILNAQMGNKTLNIASATFCFQTGFMWQVLAGRETKPSAVAH